MHLLLEVAVVKQVEGQHVLKWAYHEAAKDLLTMPIGDVSTAMKATADVT